MRSYPMLLASFLATVNSSFTVWAATWFSSGFTSVFTIHLYFAKNKRDTFYLLYFIAKSKNRHRNIFINFEFYVTKSRNTENTANRASSAQSS